MRTLRYFIHAEEKTFIFDGEQKTINVNLVVASGYAEYSYSEAKVMLYAHPSESYCCFEPFVKTLYPTKQDADRALAKLLAKMEKLFIWNDTLEYNKVEYPEEFI